MDLAAGTKLGPYEIQSPLGAGGMGEVYRARDTRLDRTVAIKILPAHLSADPAGKQRFEREAKTISILNHPHICVLHDIGSQDGIDYLVMECVEGETLAKRLERGPLPLEQVLKYGAQIADALDKAHRSGVVHRDLKPGNIMLTSTGAKLLDFGLAKPAAALAVAATLSASTKDSPVTEQGTIVGTFQYMSPEQVEGKEVDGRSDIFSLGAVLYEMVTGRRAFEGKSQISVASAILEKEPEPITTIKPMTPPTLDHVVRRCLAKDPEERWQTGRDLAQELKWLGKAENVARLPEVLFGRLIWKSRLVWTLTVGLLVLAALAFWGWTRASVPEPRPVMRWTTVFPHAHTFPSVMLAPDGSHLAFVGGAEASSPPHLYVRALDQLEAKSVSGGDPIGFFGTHFFSPDGNWIAYHTQGKLKKVPTAGGASITICDAPVTSSGTWGPDGTIIVGGTGLASLGGLSRVPAAGGKLEVLTTPDRQKGELGHGWPYFLPNGKAILFNIRTAGSWDDARIAVLNLRTGEQRVLLEGGSSPRYVPTGHLIYARAGSLFAVPFDPERLQLKGTPSPVLEGVSWYAAAGFADYSFSNSGELVYVPGTAGDQNMAMLWVDRRGKAETLAAPPHTYANPSISPDGQRVAMSIQGESPEDWDLWVYDLGRRTLTKLTYGFLNFAPVWTPDGKRLTFRNRDKSRQNSIFWVPADGSGPPQPLLATDLPATPGSWLPEGNALVFYQGTPGTPPEIRVLPVQETPAGAEPKPRTVLSNALTPQLSPDGRWLAYASAQAGIQQVYVQPFPSLTGKWQISTDGGHSPRWAQSGRELFYRNGDKMMAVDIETKAGFRAGTPKVLFEGIYAASPAPLQPGMGYDVSPDGKRFLMIKPASEPNAAQQLEVVQNWFEELRRRVPTSSK
jgi:Tol biopolymer transport system component